MSEGSLRRMLEGVMLVVTTVCGDHFFVLWWYWLGVVEVWYWRPLSAEGP